MKQEIRDAAVPAAMSSRQGFRVPLEKLAHPRRMFDFDPPALGGPAPLMPDSAAAAAMA